MTAKKYVLVGGVVQSKRDNDRHYVGPMELARLYRVDPRECYLLQEGDDEALKLAGVDRRGLTFLYPRYDGNYDLRTKP